MFFVNDMKAEILQRSSILRYDGSFTSLSAFLLCPSHTTADTESGEIRAHGTLTRTEEALLLEYREEESGIRVCVRQEGDSLTVTRAGACLSFRAGEQTSFVYKTAYGALPMEAYTQKITLTEKGRTLLLTLIYTAVFGGMAQKNEMRFKITY